MVRWVGLVIGIALGLSGCSAGSDARSDPPPVLPGVFSCPGPGAPAHPDGGSSTLPHGATGALLCQRENRTPWVAPHGTLTTRLDALVDTVNAQAVHEPSPDEGCGGVGAPAWTLVLRYPAGVREVPGDNGGCWDLLVGPTQREGSREVFRAYVDAMVAQRDAHGPGPSWRARPECPFRLWARDSPAAQPARATRAITCRAAHRPSHWQPVRRLTHAELAAVRHDVATSATRAVAHPPRLPCRRTATIAGVDAWGDPFTLYVSCRTYRTQRPGDARSTYVRMLPSTAALVDRLLAGRSLRP